MTQPGETLLLRLIPALVLLAAGCGGASIAASDGDAPHEADDAEAVDALEDMMDAADAPDDAETDADADVDGGPTPWPDDWFAMGVVPVELPLDEAQLETLRTEPHALVQVSATLGGHMVDVGVRLGSEHGETDPSDPKLDLALELDPDGTGQTFGGLTTVRLANMDRDRSMLRQQAAYATFRALGVPAPRTGYAWVTLNGEPQGLYAAIEHVADPAFLERWFGRSGVKQIYLAGWERVDLVPGDLDGLAHLRGEDPDGASLKALLAELAAIEGTAREPLMEALDRVIDVHAYLRFSAAEIFLTCANGHAMDRRNYVLFLRADGRWGYGPYGADRALRNTSDIWDAASRVHRMCLGDPACRLALGAEIERAAADVAASDVLSQVLAARAVVRARAPEDPKIDDSMEQIEGAMDFVLSRFTSWPSWLLANLECADPASVDRDGDGYSECLDDCDDADPTRHPGMPEACNLKDDDCTGVPDDDDEGACPPCVTVDDPGGGAAWILCFHPKNYEDAQAHCQEQGAELGSIHDEAGQAWLAAQTLNLWLNSWWIGLNDRDEEGSFAWTDGTPLDFEAWNSGEPNDYNGGEDCAHLSPNFTGGWNDLPCNRILPYVCRKSTP